MSNNLKEGIKLYQSRKYSDALAFFLALPPDSTDNIELAYFIGLCYARLNKYDEALLYLEQVVTNGTDVEKINNYYIKFNNWKYSGCPLNFVTFLMTLILFGRHKLNKKG